DVLPVVVDHVRRVFQEADRAEIAGEPDTRLRRGGQALEEGDGLRAGRLEGMPLCLEVALPMIALARPGVRVEAPERRPLPPDDQIETRLEYIALGLHETRHAHIAAP